MNGLGQRILAGRSFLLNFERCRLERRPAKRQAREKWLKQAYRLLMKLINDGLMAEAARIIEQVKSAYGNGFTRPGESSKLTAAVIYCLREGQGELAGLLFDAFKPLARSLSGTNLAQLFEQLAFIGLIAERNKQSYLCCKAAEFILNFWEQNEAMMAHVENKPACVAGLLALRRLGSLAMRFDQALFDEILARCDLLFVRFLAAGLSEPVTAVLGAWLHRAARNEQEENIRDILAVVEHLVNDAKLGERDFLQVAAEGQSIAGVFTCNVFSKVPQLLAERYLQIAYCSESRSCFQAMVTFAGEIGRMAIYQHGFRQSFSFLEPLLIFGRKLFQTERKFGYSEISSDFRQHCLQAILKEFCMTMEFAARQDLTTSVGEVVLWLLTSWQSQSNAKAHRKSVKLFCQLLYCYWCQMRRRKGSEEELTALLEPVLFHPADYRLFFMDPPLIG